MARHMKSLAYMPGVEFEPFTETLFIDMAKYLAGLGWEDDQRAKDECILYIVRKWREAMPDCRVRFYSIKGV